MADNSGLDYRWDLAVKTLRSGDAAGALYLFKALANDQERGAYREIAHICEVGGRGVTKDIDKAIYWYKKSIDDANDSHACLGLARVYYYGKSGDPDYEKALWYLKMIEDKNFPRANLLFGRMHRLGRGVPKDLAKAKEFLGRSAVTGNVFAIKELGLLAFESGQFVSGMALWVKSFFYAMIIGAKDVYDPRIKG